METVQYIQYGTWYGLGVSRDLTDTRGAYVGDGVYW